MNWLSLLSCFKNYEHLCDYFLTDLSATWFLSNPCELSQLWSTSDKSTEVCCHVLETRNILVSLLHGSWLLVVWIDSLQIKSNASNASDELIQFGCIGHGCKPLCYCFIKLQFWTSWWYVSFLLILALVFNSAVLYLTNCLIFLYAILLKQLQWFLV